MVGETSDMGDGGTVCTSGVLNCSFFGVCWFDEDWLMFRIFRGVFGV